MKKTLFQVLILIFGTLLFSQVLAEAAVENCANFSSWASDCQKCFKETTLIYGCNPYQTCAQSYGLSYLSDTMINTGSTDQIMYSSPSDRAGKVEFLRLQTQTDWSLSSNDMFKFPATFSPLYTGNTGIYYILSGGSSVKWIETKPDQFIRLNGVISGASRNQPAYKITFIPRTYADLGPGNLGPAIDHRQCLFIYPRFCWDGISDSDRDEQCDDGNMTSGDGCSNTCQTETTNTLACTNLTLAPTTLTKNGGSLSATCTASVASGTQYKLVLKQWATTLETIDYQSLATKTFAYILPANATITDKTYSVQCYVKNGSQTDKTATDCIKNITVPGTTPVEPAVCNSLTLSHTTIQTNTPVNYICSATNATSYIIKEWSNIIGTQPEGTFNFSTAGTYSIGCFIDGKTTTPVSCAKNITVTTPPVSTIPSIFIDKDDSTPGTPDTDGNDIQRVQNNGTATFSIRFTNNGNEALKTVVIDDSLASDCARTSAQTAVLYAGWATANFDVNESFNYQCTKTTVTASTFPNNRNTITIKWVGVTSSTNVTDSDVTEIIIKQLNPSITIEKDDDDNSDDEQEIDEGDTAQFSVKVTNDGDEALENVVITDELSRDCEKDESETRDLIRTVGNRDSLFDPNEVFAYTCEEKSVQIDTFPDEINTVCTQANGVDTDGNVDDCDDTSIITNEQVENLMCLNIESSEGAFWGAPFRTTITCDAVDYDSCEIEVTLDGEVIDTYDACTKSITLSEKGNYSVACIVNNERTPDCEMEIEVAAMTDIPTGTKIFILAFLSILLAALGTHLYKKRAS